MTARKCDRCGKFYDITSGHSEIIFKKRSKGFIKAPIEIDLCPECTEFIDSWFSNKIEQQEAQK